MAHYCIGDVQGCFSELMALLKYIKFNEQQDKLWFTGDLVNRGPQSLETLRFVKALGNHAITVLGNHDLHLLAVAYGRANLQTGDTLQDVLDAPDCKQLCDWLRQQPLLHHDAHLGYILVHAGLPPQWDLEQAKSYAHEVELVLQSDHYSDFLAEMYGSEPNCWNNALSGYPRLRLITNYLTRLRFCDAIGTLELVSKRESHLGPAGYFPWFNIPERKTKALNILFGHWAALKGHTNNPTAYALDTGCIWGNSLTALRLEDGKRFSVSCATR